MMMKLSIARMCIITWCVLLRTFACFGQGLCEHAFDIKNEIDMLGVM